MENKLEKTLQEKYGFKQFKPGQKETIESVLENERTLSILPTGTGKTLCYQLAGAYLTGKTVIVSPLLSLMEDQVFQMKESGSKAAVAINSNMSYEEKKWVLAHLNQYDYLFFSPETILQENVRQKLGQLAIGLFVVDEAHCISQWGIDFRPEYEQLYQIVDEIHAPKILGLTATATKNVIVDIKEKLFKGQESNLIQYSVNRENIAYQVVRVKEKDQWLQEFVEKYESPGIIYFSSRKKTMETARYLAENSSLRVSYYHGGMSSQERNLIQQQFLTNQLDVLCATNAFGMGINKPNVRFVIHYHLPASIEAYVQESGRGGRDGEQSLSIILYQEGDEYIQRQLQQTIEENKQLLKVLQKLNEKEIKKFSENFTDIQKKWIDGYFLGLYSLTELEESVKKKQIEKQVQMDKMLDYIQSKECRRKLLLIYFDEKEIEKKQSICCDNCGFRDNIFLGEKKKGVERTKERFWRETLRNLFIIENRPT